MVVANHTWSTFLNKYGMAFVVQLGTDLFDWSDTKKIITFHPEVIIANPSSAGGFELQNVISQTLTCLD